jgi:hypothetical protein
MVLAALVVASPLTQPSGGPEPATATSALRGSFAPEPAQIRSGRSSQRKPLPTSCVSTIGWSAAVLSGAGMGGDVKCQPAISGPNPIGNTGR